MKTVPSDEAENQRRSCFIELDLARVVRFYDYLAEDDPQEEDQSSSISAMTGMIGEDLVLGLLVHYLESRSNWTVRIVHSCKAAEAPRFKLDAWVMTPEVAYQVEVKNWGATAIGAQHIENGDRNLLKAAKHNYRRYLIDEDNRRCVWKVVCRANRELCRPQATVAPLLAFWSPIVPADAEDLPEEPMFVRSISDYDLGGVVPDKDFSEVTIFSASLYARALILSGAEKVNLRMCRAAKRIRQINDLLRIIE